MPWQIYSAVSLSHLMAKRPSEANVAYIREVECIGCTKCIQACPVDAIIGAAKQMHTVIEDECTGCDLCVDPCPVDCIDMLPPSTPLWPVAARCFTHWRHCKRPYTSNKGARWHTHLISQAASTHRSERTVQRNAPSRRAPLPSQVTFRCASVAAAPPPPVSPGAIMFALAA